MFLSLTLNPNMKRLLRTVAKFALQALDIKEYWKNISKKFINRIKITMLTSNYYLKVKTYFKSHKAQNTQLKFVKPKKGFEASIS
jgi:hypothetical protein